MKTRLIRLRFRRRIRKGQKQVEDLGSQAEKQIEQHVFKRFGHFAQIRRFVIGWIGLMFLLIAGVTAQNIMLSDSYQSPKTIPGGIYNEGVRGRFTNASPLYATSEADTTVSRLIFAGLLKHDARGKLVGELARDYSIDVKTNTYTVRLKPGLKWQDGKPLTSADVLFTYQLIQNPDAQSPLQSSWQGITVNAPNAQTVVFKLPGALAAFPHNLTNGIVPRHLLADIPPSDMRSADFNTVKPIGAGPFAWQAIEVTDNGDRKNAKEKIALSRFEGYAGGAPKLQQIVIEVFASEQQLVEAFSGNKLTAAEGLAEVPGKLKDQNDVVQHSFTLRAATMVFFKTTSGVLSDQSVRQALVKGSNTPEIISKLGYSTRAVRQPLLNGQTGYDQSLVQAKFDLKAAKADLESKGWVVGKGGIRAKDGKQLAFTLTTANTRDYHMVAGQLQKQWRQLGAKVNVQFLDAGEFQNALTYHSYDAILNSISIGVDPDVFVYWDSSQADIRASNRLNFSEYKNPTADASLEAGRTRLDPSLRVIKYKPFLQSWQQDAPALGLYQPRLLYLTRGYVSGLEDRPINIATDRFANVENWQIREARVTD